MNITGAKLHKTHTLHIKKQFANQWLKNKKEKLNKKELKRLKKLKEQKMKLQTYLASRKDMHTHNLKGIGNAFSLFL